MGNELMKTTLTMASTTGSGFILPAPVNVTIPAPLFVTCRI